MPITFNPNVSFKQQQPAAQVPLNPVTESIYTPIEQEKPAKKLYLKQRGDIYFLLFVFFFNFLFRRSEDILR